jgi:hypothetical protein
VSALTLQAIAARPLVRPIFNTNTYALRSIESFGMANGAALRAWYDALTLEAQAIGEDMPTFRTFVAIQRDIELAVVGLTIEPLRERMYALEREPRYLSWDEREANAVGSRTQGPL